MLVSLLPSVVSTVGDTFTSNVLINKSFHEREGLYRPLQKLNGSSFCISKKKKKKETFSRIHGNFSEISAVN